MPARPHPGWPADRQRSAPRGPCACRAGRDGGRRSRARPCRAGRRRRRGRGRCHPRRRCPAPAAPGPWRRTRPATTLRRGSRPGQILRPGHGVRIAVDRHHAATGLRQEKTRVAPAAEGGVDIEAAVAWHECCHGLGRQHGYMLHHRLRWPEVIHRSSQERSDRTLEVPAARNPAAVARRRDARHLLTSGSTARRTGKAVPTASGTELSGHGMKHTVAH